ncbi:MAG: lipoprotein-releasing system transmembrane subunit LolC, partial [Pseudomonadales bacterium]
FLAFNLSGVVQFFEQLSGSRMFDPSVFYVSFLPSQWLLSDFLWVVGASVVLTILATIIPAWQASKITPTEALTYKQ